MEQKTFEFLGEKVTLNFPKERQQKVYESIQIFEESLNAFSRADIPNTEKIILAAIRLADEVRSLKTNANDQGKEIENWLTGIQQRIQYSLESNG